MLVLQLSMKLNTLVSSKVLVHYDPDLPIRVAADASSYGSGAVLSHVLRDGTEHPMYPEP